MQSSATQVKDWFEPTSSTTPATLPVSGDWSGTLSGPGIADYFWFAGQTNRTLSIEVTATGESGALSESKAQPVIGVWSLSDTGTSPAPASTRLAFNSSNFAMTRLEAALQANTNFRVGIFDYRGDGRPDYGYRARVFYGNSVTPSRARVNGGTAISGAWAVIPILFPLWAPRVLRCWQCPQIR